MDFEAYTQLLRRVWMEDPKDIYPYNSLYTQNQDPFSKVLAKSFKF